MQVVQEISVIDAHTCGTPIRLVRSGLPLLKGASVQQKMADMQRRHDWLRTCVMQQPRGFASLVGAVLVEPCLAEADYGVFFIDALTYQPMCGAGIFAVAKILVETGMVPRVAPLTRFKLETPAGLVHLQVHIEQEQISRIALENVPAFLYRQALPLEVAGLGAITVDIGFGGNFFVLVDGPRSGLRLTRANIADLRAFSKPILAAANEAVQVAHPLQPATNYLDQVLFYERVEADADAHIYLGQCIYGDAQADISPCGTGSCANLARLFLQGALAEADLYEQRSVYGGAFQARVLRQTDVNGYAAVVPQISCSDVQITGFNQLIVESRDRLKGGFTTW